MGQYETVSSLRHEGYNTEFSALRAYLLSKVFWNPLMDEAEYNRHMNEFLAGYYGEGWMNIRRYIEFLVQCVGDRHCRLYEGPNGLYDGAMYRDALPQIEAWFADAIAKANFAQKDHLELLKLHMVFLKLFFSWDNIMQNGDEASRAAAIRENEWLWNELQAREICLSEQCRIVEKPDFTQSPREWFLIPAWIHDSDWNVQ